MSTSEILRKLAEQTGTTYVVRKISEMRYFSPEKDAHEIFSRFEELLSEENRKFIASNSLATRFFIVHIAPVSVIGIDVGTVNSIVYTSQRHHLTINCQGTA